MSPSAPLDEHLPVESAAEDFNEVDALDPDPGCLDLESALSRSINADAQQGPQLTMFQSLENIFENTCLEDLITSIEFIRALQSASHDDIHCKIDQSTIDRLRNPPSTPFDISSLPDLRLGLDLFLANMNSSVESFNANRDAIMRRHPAHRVPSYDQMKRQISSITGVGSVIHAMCKNSCLAFTGPFADLDHCPKCGEPKFCPGTKKFQQEFHTILLGPVLQALWRDASSARNFYY